jgi:serine/threonine-protein kinase
MELCEGQTVQDNRPASMDEAVRIFQEVAKALMYMNARGFVHADMKPNNILISPSGAIKIIDLGQSCPIGTTKSRIQGTPDYIAPEQVKRRTLGPRTDVFNLGATMYWALTGKNVPTLIPKKIATVGRYDPQRCYAPHDLKQQIPVGVSNLVMDCVKQDPAERPTNMMDVISRLDLMIHSIFGGKIRANRNASNNHRSAQ